MTAYVSDKDTATERVCGCCGNVKPLSAFYKDGLDSKGNVRYRRDCKDCYKKTRVIESRAKTKRGVRL